MLKCASLFTYEVDNPEIALEEIKAQLDDKLTLLENSVGIILCHTEFISTGVLKYICENLPFELAGITTASQAVNGEAGELMLTIFVMTSDDVQFKIGVTESLGEDINGPIKAAYDKTAAGDSTVPKLALIFPPFLFGFADDAYVRTWGKTVPNMPVFGTLAIDDSASFNGSETIYNGINYKTAMSFILCYGNIIPRFIVGVLPENNIMSDKGKITKSNGPFVQEINNMNAYEYFKGLGIDSATTDRLMFVPFMIDLIKREDYDGIPVIRAHESFTEDGTAIFRGDVDEGSTFTLLTFEPDDVLSTTQRKIEQINELSNVNGVLLFSCIVRRMVILGANPLAELEMAKDKINSEIPFMMGYAGGEFCPTSVRDGIPTNRFHNYSLVMLII